MLEEILETTEIVKDLKKLRERLDSIIETLEIMADKELMESIERARDQPKKREFREFLKALTLCSILIK